MKKNIPFLRKLDKLKYVPDNTFLVSLDDKSLGTGVPYAMVKKKQENNLWKNTPLDM